MVKFALVLAALAGSAAAFAPASSSVNSKTAVDAFAKGYVGNEGPEPMPPGFNSVDFDPLGLAEVRFYCVTMWS
jgi:hypothetical protein